MPPYCFKAFLVSLTCPWIAFSIGIPQVPLGRSSSFMLDGIEENNPWKNYSNEERPAGKCKSIYYNKASTKMEITSQM